VARCFDFSGGLILALQDYWAARAACCCNLPTWKWAQGPFTPPPSCAPSAPSLGARPTCSRRAAPTDGRYGENPNRLQHYYQYQVVIKPSPLDLQDLYLGSLKELGIDPLIHDVRFVEDNWESPDARRLGPGLGGVAERYGNHPVHLFPAGWRAGLQAGHR